VIACVRKDVAGISPNLTAYELGPLIERTGRALLFAGRRRSDGQAVLIKRQASEFPSEADVAHYKRAFNLGKAADPPGVVRHLELVSDGAGVALVTLALPGQNLGQLLLTSARPSVQKALELGLALTREAQRIHALLLIHGNIEPKNIIVDAQGQVALIDFAAAARLSQLNESIGTTSQSEIDLGYCAPERTGRTNRTVDTRADLYAIGINLFLLLTGRLPFEERDDLALIHAHMARTPERVDRLSVQLPALLGQLVARALAKDPDERYQTAHGLAHDLEQCLKQLAEHGRILEFPLGTRDRPARLVLPQRLYGRTDDLARLRAGLLHTSRTGPSLLTICGHSGIGKSALIDEVAPELETTHGLIVRGRFEPLGRDIPLAAFARALDDLTSQLADRFGPEHLESVVRRVQELHGVEAVALLDLVPSLGHLLEPVAQVMTTDRVVRARRHAAVGELLQQVCAETPLIMVLDDMQWADEASLSLLRYLLAPETKLSVSLVCMWRKEEVGPTHPLTNTIEVIAQTQHVLSLELGPLGAPSIRELVDDALALEPQHADVLSQALHAQSGGNPFFLRQLLSSMYADRQLVFDEGSARWELRLSPQPPQIVGVEDFMLTRMTGLPLDSFRLLQTASHLGSELTLSELALTTGFDVAETWRCLEPALSQGFIQLRGAADRFRFPHDRVREALWHSVSEDVRAELHFVIAIGLIEKLSATEREGRITELADHVVHALSKIDSSEFALVGIDVELGAARRAVASGAFEQAETYVRAARTLLLPIGWTAEPERCLEALLLLARVINSRGDSEGLKALAREAELAGCEKVRLIPLYDLMFGAAYADGNLQQAIETGSLVLARYDVHISAKANMSDVLLRVARLWWMLKRRLPRSVLELPVAEDPTAVAAVELLRRLLPLAYRASETVSALYLTEAALRAVRCGRSAAAGAAWGTVAVLAIEIFDDAVTAEHAMNLGRELAEKHQRTDILMELEANRALLISPWLRPFQETIPPMDDCYHTALRTGDSYMISHLAIILAFYRTFRGDPLPRMMSQTEAFMALLNRHDLALADLRVLRQYLACLTEDTQPAGELAGEHFTLDTDLASIQDITTRSCATMLGAHIAVTLGTREQMARAFTLARPEIKGPRHTFLRAMWPHYVALCCLGSLPDQGAARRRGVAYARARIEDLKRIAKATPSNVDHRIAHVRAGVERALGNVERALDLYNQAAILAKRYGWLHEAALIHHQACEFLLERGDAVSASGHFREAAHLYRRWGAVRALGRLAARWQEALGEDARPPGLDLASTPTDEADDRLDLNTVMRSAQAISREVNLEEIVRTLLLVVAQNAGASAATLVRKHEGEPWVVGQLKHEQGAPVTRFVNRPLSAEEDGIPAALVRVALLLSEPRIIDDAQTEKDLFAELTPLRERGVRSVALAPLIRQDRSAGVLILENELSAHVFTSARARLLEVVAAQAAISMENAVLYADLQSSLHAQIELTEANGRFVPGEFLAALGRPTIATVSLGDSVQKEMTVLFSDIRGFTRLVEGMSPNENIAFINEYLHQMEPAIMDHQGFIDSYVGDAIMALFDGGAHNAVRAAVDMLVRLRALNMKRQSHGQRALAIGIGVNTGPLTLGTIGGPSRIKCGVIGDSVNLAARIETATKQYGVALLIGQDALDSIPEPQALDIRQVDCVRVVGRNKPVALYEVFDADSDAVRLAKRATLPSFEQGFTAYQAGHFALARAAWLECIAALPSDPVVQLLDARCQRLQEQPLPRVWDGVYDLERK